MESGNPCPTWPSPVVPFSGEGLGHGEDFIISVCAPQAAVCACALPSLSLLELVGGSRAEGVDGGVGALRTRTMGVPMAAPSEEPAFPGWGVRERPLFCVSACGLRLVSVVGELVCVWNNSRLWFLKILPEVVLLSFPVILVVIRFAEAVCRLFIRV